VVSGVFRLTENRYRTIVFDDTYYSVFI